MDFDSHFSPLEKSGEVLAANKKDHSPSNDINVTAAAVGDAILSAGTKISNSSDDFEHIIHDKIDSDFDLLGGPPTSPPFSLSGESAQIDLIAGDNKFDDFASFGTPKKSTNDFDLLSSANKAAATIDFMAAERNGPPAKAPVPAPIKPVVVAEPLAPSPVPINIQPILPEPIAAAVAPAQPESISAAPLKPTIYDEIENDYLNPYASTKNNEKFISSEDLIGDFKDEDDEPISIVESRNKTPDLFKDTNASASLNAARTHDSDDDEIPAPAPKPIEPEVLIKPAPVEQPKPVVEKPDVIHSKVEEIKPIKPSGPPPAIPTKAPAKRVQMISAEEIFYKIGLGKYTFFFFVFLFLVNFFN